MKPTTADPTISPSTPTSRICSTCTATVFTPNSFGAAWRTLPVSFRSTFRYHVRWSSVTAGSSSGCSWCNVILSLREPSDDAAPFVTIEVRLRKARDDQNDDKARPKGVQSLSVWMNGVPRASFYVYTSPGNYAAEFITARSLVRDLSSPRSTEMARMSLQRCINEHPQCRRASPTSNANRDPDSADETSRAVPTRLIDCGVDGGSHIRLVSTKDPSSPADSAGYRYVTLSYVWGSPQNNNSQAAACSSSGNIASRMADGLEIRLLPETVRDAVTVTRRLGLRWLWIDALCILQDSPEDKIRELPKMRAIYRSAFVTIIAANAKGSNEGFLGDRDPSYDSGDPEIPFVLNGGQDERDATIFLSPVWTQYDERKEPVNSRAWCLQERMLSTRALIYASHTLQYRCLTEAINIGDGLYAPPVGPSGPDLAPLLSENLETQVTATQLRDLWNSIVEEYSQRSLTVSFDKLNAIAGVADLVHLRHSEPEKCRYLAGLWCYDGPDGPSLVRNLLWFKDYASRLPRPREYRAPSWSWAAVNGRVLMENIDDRVRIDRAPPGDVEECCKILECATVLKDQRVPFGEVQNSVLRMSAVVVKVECDLAVEWPEVRWEGSVVGIAFADTVEEIAEDGEIAEKVWAVPMVCNRKAGYAEGILMTRAQQKDGAFSRVGYFHSAEESAVVVEWLQSFTRTEFCIV